MSTLRHGDHGVIRTADTSLGYMNGKEARVIYIVASPDDHHDEEVLPMYGVEVDGQVVEIWADELVKREA